MTLTVHLHVGEPKTGTTYLQAMLDGNREALAADGLVVPGSRLDQVRAGNDLLDVADDRGGGAWAALVDQIGGFDGAAAVVSMESLVLASPEQAERAVSSFPGCEVRVVLTLRDLARVVPAQWQESLQFRHTWTLPDYVAGVTAARPRTTAPGRSFWRQHDVVRELEVWGGAVGDDRVTVVTLPARSSSPRALWDRFCTALGVDPSHYADVPTANESLGAVSAEVMRRFNEALEEGSLTRTQYGRLVRTLLSKQVLAARRGREPKVTVPRSLDTWAHRRSARLVEQLRGSAVTVVGDLADLASPAPGDVDPGYVDVPDADVAAAAVDALVGLVVHTADRAGRSVRADPDRR